MPKPSQLAAQSPATVASLRSVLGVDALEALVESAAGPTYASIALGEAATTTGQSFAVDNGDGTVSIYLRTGGGSTLQRTLATAAALAAALAADGGAALVGFKQSGTGAVARTVQDKGREVVSAGDFGAVGDGVADDTAAIHTAIAHVQSLGGGVVELTKQVYRCNIVITGTNVVLRHRNSPTNRNLSARIRPFNAASPAITIGDGVASTHTIGLERISLRGESGDTKGLLVNGAFDVYLSNYSSRGFSEYCHKTTSTAARPTFHVFISDFAISPGNYAAANGAVQEAGGSFNTSNYWSNGHFSSGGASHGHLFKLDGNGVLGSASNVWVEGASGQGIEFVGGAKLSCANVTVDSDSNTHVLLKLGSGTSISDHLTGLFNVDGLFQSSAGTSTKAISGQPHLPYRTVLTGAHVLSTLGFLDTNLPVHQRYEVGDPAVMISRLVSHLVLRSSVGNIRTVHSVGGFLDVRDTSDGLGKIRFAQNGPQIIPGTGTPEGVVDAPVGSLFLRSDGGVATTFYVKETGVGNTGWVAK